MLDIIGFVKMRKTETLLVSVTLVFVFGTALWLAVLTHEFVDVSNENVNKLYAMLVASFFLLALSVLVVVFKARKRGSF